jgi:hypothetical protein
LIAIRTFAAFTFLATANRLRQSALRLYSVGKRTAKRRVREFHAQLIIEHEYPLRHSV